MFQRVRTVYSAQYRPMLQARRWITYWASADSFQEATQGFVEEIPEGYTLDKVVCVHNERNGEEEFG